MAKLLRHKLAVLLKRFREGAGCDIQNKRIAIY
jgi:hypothetical protein